jgi:ribosomal protein S18 acetylase RimI-like enzyme
MEFEVIAAEAAAVDGLKTLWLQMLAHHRDLIGGEIPLRTDEQSWARTRRVYSEWLEKGTATLVIARARSSSEPLGYAVCRLVAGDGRTFDLGAVRGDLDSLVVHDQARGQGIGTALLAAVRDGLLDRGIAFWSVGVIAHNLEAVKLYERVGFRPWTQALIASTRNP